PFPEVVRRTGPRPIPGRPVAAGAGWTTGGGAPTISERWTAGRPFGWRGGRPPPALTDCPLSLPNSMTHPTSCETAPGLAEFLRDARRRVDEALDRFLPPVDDGSPC